MIPTNLKRKLVHHNHQPNESVQNNNYYKSSKLSPRSISHPNKNVNISPKSNVNKTNCTKSLNHIMPTPINSKSTLQSYQNNRTQNNHIHCNCNVGNQIQTSSITPTSVLNLRNTMLHYYNTRPLTNNICYHHCSHILTGLPTLAPPPITFKTLTTTKVTDLSITTVPIAPAVNTKKRKPDHSNGSVTLFPSLPQVCKRPRKVCSPGSASGRSGQG